MMQPVQTRYSTVDALEFPGIITLRVLLSGSQTNGSHAIFEDIVEPGVGPGRHIHHGQDETFFFLEGAFDAEIGGVFYHMEPGDIGFVPRVYPVTAFETERHFCLTRVFGSS